MMSKILRDFIKEKFVAAIVIYILLKKFINNRFKYSRNKKKQCVVHQLQKDLHLKTNLTL